MSTILVVYLKPHARPAGDRAQFMVVETGFASFDEAIAAIAADEMFVVRRLFTHFGAEPGLRIIHDTRDLGLRGSAVDRVEIPSWRIVPEDAA